MGLVLALTGLYWGSNQANAQVFGPPIANPAGAAGFNSNVNYDLPNWAYSPNIRKFISALPGLGAPGCTPNFGAGTCNENNLNQYIPIARPDTTTFPDADYYVIGASQYSLKLHSDLPATTLRGYRQENAPGFAGVQNVNQYLGPMIIAKSYDPTKPPGENGNGKPVRVLYKNELPLTSDPITHGNLFLPVDPTVMGAGMGPVAGVNYTQNRIALHLHGGATPWISDGTPHQWITPAGEPAVAGQPLYQKGASFANVPDMVNGSSYPGPGNPSALSVYPGGFPAQPCIGGPCFVPSGTDGMGTLYYTNQQSGRLMFYHDHAYGITRLNVYAGLAAPFLLTDQVEEDMISGTNVSGASTGKVLPDLGGVYHYGIPLVIQDKTFVNDATTPPGAGFPAGATPTHPTAVDLPGRPASDPRWNSVGGNGVWAAGTTPPAGGSLWLPHEYMPNEDIYDPSGANPRGRWDYGPWLNPPAVPLNANLPTPTITPEAFMDTMLVNGTPYPYVNVPAGAVRFRILNACNDRSLNLSLFVADPAAPTEVKMVPAAPGVDPNWPVDGRNGGVPDPALKGPSWYQIGNEGGLLPQVAVIPPQPVVFEQSRLLPTVLSIANKSLFIMPAVRADVVVDFSAYAGKTLILYNDAPAAAPLFDERYDLYTGDPDMRSTGGAPTTPAGFGPNTRTIMQIRVSANGAAPFNLGALQAALPKAFGATQAPPIVKQAAYNPAFGTANVDTFVNNTDSTVNLVGGVQSVSRVLTTLGGSGYTTAPAVSFISADGNGSGAAATAALDGVTAVTVTLGATSPATPYTLPPTVAIVAPIGCGALNNTTCVQATAVASISGGQVTAITVTDPGAGYTAECTAATNPAVTITTALGDPTGAGATAASGLTCGAVAHIQVTNGGSGYTKAPFVYLTGGGGTGATADARLTNDSVIGMKNITEGFDINYGRMNVMLGTTPTPLEATLVPPPPAPAVPGIAQYIDPPSDFWNDGQTYVFRLSHLGVDNHAVHFHLANLQVVNRVDFTNTMLPPEANELGWKETVRTEPFTDLILAVQPRHMSLPFPIPRSTRLMDVTTPAGSTANYIQPAPVPGTPTPAGISNVVTDFGWEYVWHCHLLGHEENDMMRPIVFNPLLMSPPTGNPLPNTTLGKPFWYTNGGPAPAEAVVFTVGAISPATGSDHYRFTLNYVPTSTGVPVSTVVQDWNTLTTWTMTGFPAGSYTLTVDAGTGAAPVAPDVTGELAFEIVPPPATDVTLAVSPPSPQTNNTTVTFTATGVGSNSYQYRFQKNGTTVQDYSTSNTWTMPLSMPSGIYQITVDVRTNPLSATADATSSPLAYTVTVGGDFNSDGFADIVWRNAASGQVEIWNMNGTTLIAEGSPATISDPNWEIRGVGDFNSDSVADIVWRNKATGQVEIWLMNGDTIALQGSPATIGDLNWDIKGVGKREIIWQNKSTGQVEIWQMNGTIIASQASPATVSDLNWDIKHVGNFNGDGSADILWQNKSTGQVFIWLMNGTTLASQGSPGTISDLNWQIRGVGDFNGDGSTDILWRHATSGQVYIWLMNGTTVVSQGSPATVSDLNWEIRGTRDYNGDGKSDILWRNKSTGQVMIWLMNGTTLASQGSPGTVGDLNWDIK